MSRAPLRAAARAALALVPAFLVLVAGASAQDAGLPDHPGWGRGAFQPEGKNALFATADGCALCHSHSDRARALTTQMGDDVSPHGLWRATLMANSFRDPYWRAQMASEIERAPERKAEIEALCFTCHAPMSSHTARVAGTALPSLEALEADPLANDGVSCTVCHQAQPTNFGTRESFNGRLDLRPERRIFGPYEKPQAQPMLAHTAFQAEHAPWIQDAGLCGSCHTLFTTDAKGHAFPEQTPYLEWKNSDFARAPEDGGETCQDCHMQDVGRMKIARNPMGADFNIPIRDHVRAHAFVGGNAYMLDLLAKNAEVLGVTAPKEAFERLSRAARAQLAHETARVSLENVVREGTRLRFDVRIENLTGHKFPTGYPARRAWLRVEVQQGRKPVFASGVPDENGRLQEGPELGRPHVDRVTDASQVPVYEMLAADAEGRPTTSLLAMASRTKDNRLLPKGWQKDGPFAAETHPVGVEHDPDFQAGSDVVHYEIDGLDESAGRPLIIARLLYQPIPPAWVEPLRGSGTEAAKRFVGMYDDHPAVPEVVGLAAQSVE